MTIGGSTTGLGNVISGNSGAGVEIQATGGSSGSEIVQGNRIGISATGSTDLGNDNNGISLEGGDGNTIGGAGAAGNSVFFNFNGIVIDSNANNVAGNSVENNDRVGMFVEASSNTIGGNVVLANVGAGVFVTNGTGNRISGNQMSGNGGLGIDLQGGTEDSFGVTANDTGDPDTGPNALQNFPVLQGAIRSTSTGTTVIAGKLNSNPNTAYTIQFFSVVADPSGHGEGSGLLGSKSVTTNSAGNVNFSFSTTHLNVGARVTATAIATTAGNTSEFAANVAVQSIP